MNPCFQEIIELRCVEALHVLAVVLAEAHFRNVLQRETAARRQIVMRRYDDCSEDLISPIPQPSSRRI